MKHFPRPAIGSLFAALIATAALLVLTAAPASAATPSACSSANTLDANKGKTAADIQALLSAVPTVTTICLRGTFSVTTALEYGHDVALLGLSKAVLKAPAAPAAGNGILVNTTGAIDTLTVRDIRFTGGRAPTSLGAAILGDTVNVYDSQFDHNQAGRGGAIGANAVHVEDSTFTSNSSDRGGAIYSDGTTIIGSTFTLNSSTDLGGAINAGDTTVTSSTFSGNSTEQDGGALSVNALTATNDTFVHNAVTQSGGLGAAVAINRGTVLQSTFLDNSTPSPTGAQSIWIGSGPTAVLTIGGDIFANHSGTLHIAVDGGSVNDLGGNLFTTSKASETYFISTVVTLDPSTRFGVSLSSLFGTHGLADNGGPVETIALPIQSAAIDAVPTSTVTVDARGHNRTVPNDAGAFEFGPSDVPATTGSPSLPITGVDPTAGMLAATFLFGLGLALSIIAGRNRARAAR